MHYVHNAYFEEEVGSTLRSPSPGVVAFVGFAAPAKLTPFESAGASALHTLQFGFNPGDATALRGCAN